MPYYGGRWHRYSEAEQKAFGEAKRKALSITWHKTWISKAGLKERLWTDKAIVDFLGPAIDAGPIKAWPLKAALKAEKSQGFKTWMQERLAWLTARGKLPPETEAEPKPKPKKSRKTETA
ncbi:hypothetical protein D9M71_610230 [compost metagenome]